RSHPMPGRVHPYMPSILSFARHPHPPSGASVSAQGRQALPPLASATVGMPPFNQQPFDGGLNALRSLPIQAKKQIVAILSGSLAPLWIIVQCLSDGLADGVGMRDMDKGPP